MTRAALAALLTLLLASSAEAAVTRVEITRREPFAGGHAFDGAGAYEKVVGRVHGELDPAHPMNRGIVDLDLAPRNARGRVEYTTDLYILRPADLARGNGALLYDVNNRGRKYALAQHNSGRAGDDPDTLEHAGNGFLMRYAGSRRPATSLPSLSTRGTSTVYAGATVTGSTRPITPRDQVTAPTATLTGWALRSPQAGGGALCGLDGSMVPFARTKAEREAKGDPRPSLDERYGDQAGYVAKVRQAAAALERERYLLAEDVTRIVDEATAHR